PLLGKSAVLPKAVFLEPVVSEPSAPSPAAVFKSPLVVPSTAPSPNSFPAFAAQASATTAVRASTEVFNCLENILIFIFCTILSAHCALPGLCLFGLSDSPDCARRH